MLVYTGMAGGGIVNCLNALLNNVLGCAAAMILKICCFNVKIFPLLEELPQEIIP